jgi:hypothetical protein
MPFIFSAVVPVSNSHALTGRVALARARARARMQIDVCVRRKGNAKIRTPSSDFSVNPPIHARFSDRRHRIRQRRIRRASADSRNRDVHAGWMLARVENLGAPVRTIISA